MRPVTTRWARIGPREPKTLFHTPEEGVCLSAFVVARRGSAILLGRPRAAGAWPEKGGFPRFRAEGLEKDESWLLPATHLLMEESPDHAARRVAREWAGLRGTPRFVEVQSHPQSAGRWRQGRKNHHWDLCFVYELHERRAPDPMPWWSELRFFSPREIRELKIGRGHMDVLEAAGYLGRGR